VVSLIAPEHHTSSRVFHLVERAIDVLAALIGLALLAALIPFVALGHLLWSPGPLFYRQTRVGRRGRLFQVVKFRTMIPDAEKHLGLYGRKRTTRARQVLGGGCARCAWTKCPSSGMY